MVITGTMMLTKSQAYRALEGASNARRTLLAGFTAVRDVESEGSGYADVALRDAIERGLVEGPRMKVATREKTERCRGVGTYSVNASLRKKPAKRFSTDVVMYGCVVEPGPAWTKRSPCSFRKF